MTFRSMLFAVTASIMLLTQAVAQRNYRIKKVGNVEFVLPPGAKLAWEGLFNCNKIVRYQQKKKFKYQYMVVRGLRTPTASTRYYDAVKLIEKAETHHTKAPATSLLLYKYNITGAATPSGDGRSGVYLSNDHSTVAIELDMDAFIQGAPGSIVDNFRASAISLYKQLAGIEANWWTNGVAMKLMEGLFDYLPVPLEASVSRYAYLSPEQCYKSVLLLDPDFTLKVDAVEQHYITAIVDVGKWYNKISSYEIGFSRDDKGYIVQDKLGSSVRQAGLRADNLFDPNQAVYLISSFSDIQQSDALKDLPYLLLVDPIFRKNNDQAGDGSVTALTSPDDRLTGNLCIVHLSNTQLNTFNFACPDLTDKIIYKSVFGKRTGVEVLIPLTTRSGTAEKIQLGTRFKEMRTRFPAHAHICRRYGNGFRRVTGDTDELILLPNDQINY